MVAWDQHRDLLQRLYIDEQLGAGVIAGHLSNLWHVPLTRNQICGALHRLGLQRPKLGSNLSRRQRSISVQPTVKKTKQTRVRRCGSGVVVAKDTYDELSCPQILVDDNAIPISQRKTLMELKDEHCRWPIGEPGTDDFFFCGAPTYARLSYCLGHCRAGLQNLPSMLHDAPAALTEPTL